MQTKTINGKELAFLPCARCNGNGNVPGYEHVEGGLCFKCKGECGIWVDKANAERTLAKRAKRAAHREKVAAQKAAAEKGHMSNFEAENPGLLEALAARVQQKRCRTASQYISQAASGKLTGAHLLLAKSLVEY